jgi:class 3 adenylate cyclase
MSDRAPPNDNQYEQGNVQGRKGRFDFKIEVVDADEETHIVQVKVEPDPRRYDRVDNDGQPYFLDRYLRVLVSFDEMAAQMAGLPIFASPRTIESAEEYAATRREAVESELLTGAYSPPTEQAKPHETLAHDSPERDMAFLSVDVCGSTARRARSPRDFDTALRILIQELGTVVGQFHGSMLKTTGDGFIAYIDLPSFTVACDATIDLGGTMRVVLRDSINPALVNAGLEPLEIRIGADYGSAAVHQLAVQTTGFTQVDITSDALNRAVKIQESCGPGEFRIGRELYELVHVQWLERAAQVPFDSSLVGLEGYEVYEIN